MTTVFADAFYYFALVNPADERHQKAREFTAAFTGKIVTTAWIMTEVGDGLARAVNRRLFLEMISELRTDPDVLIVPPGLDLFEEGLDLYRQRPDKDWSLTDCISFAVMTQQRITHSLTGDRHFEQAGFVALLK
jgi:predicted nucleic acid-binding protein